MTRIAIVSDSVYPFHKGGKESRLYEITRRLARAGEDVHIYTMKWWEGPRVIEREGVHYHALCDLRPLYINGRRSIKEALIFGLATFKMLFEPFDVIDVDHMPFYPLFSARVVCWLRGKKLLATWLEVWGKEYWQTYTKGFIGRIGYITERFAFLLPDNIISISAHTTERLQAAGVKVPIVTIPLGVDTASIQSVIPSKQTSDLIYIGRFLSHKNVLLLLDAVALAAKTRPGITLLIVGNGPEKQRIEARIRELGIQQHVTLRTDVDTNEEKYALLRSSKMLVLPSEREGFGLVILEGNAAGLPVITVDCPTNASKDLVHNGENGLVVELSARSIADGIIAVLESHRTLNPMRDIQKYDWMTVSQDIKNVYHSMHRHAMRI